MSANADAHRMCIQQTQNKSIKEFAVIYSCPKDRKDYHASNQSLLVVIMTSKTENKIEPHILCSLGVIHNILHDISVFLCVYWDCGFAFVIHFHFHFQTNPNYISFFFSSSFY